MTLTNALRAMRRRPPTTFLCAALVALGSLVAGERSAASGPLKSSVCQYYNTTKDQDFCNYPGADCDQYETTKIGPGCDGFPASGCCSGDVRVYCNLEGTALCAADCGQFNKPCGKPGPKTGAACSTAPNYWGDPLDCADVPVCDCEDRECGPGPCLGSCGTCPPDKPQCTFEGKCVPCTPQCSGKVCGADGCGGDCGPCPGGQVCLETQGTCCSPDCLGRSCGPDGCGGSCGVCGVGDVCTAGGTCTPNPTGCEAGPTPGCGCACSDCVCQADPFCCEVTWDALCAGACAGCGGGCPTPLCVPSCGGAICGPYDGCGGSCGSCPDGTYCGALGAKCLPCTCDKRECGDDGCGDSCGSCPVLEVCAAGQCVPRGCGETEGPGCAGCECEACVCDLDPYCCQVRWDALCAQHCARKCGAVSCPCVNKCQGRECGPAYCYFEMCGSCAPPAVCTPGGLCCTPDCEGKECGSDGCFDSCGDCPQGEVCAGGACVCVPVCGGKECGPDGCGGECGACEGGELCANGTCHAAFPASCLGAGQPSALDCPAGLDAQGCCDAQGRAVWCGADGQLYCDDCAACGLSCGLPIAAPGDSGCATLDGGLVSGVAGVADADVAGGTSGEGSGTHQCFAAGGGSCATVTACGALGCWAGCAAGQQCVGGQCDASPGPDASSLPDSSDAEVAADVFARQADMRDDVAANDVSTPAPQDGGDTASVPDGASGGSSDGSPGDAGGEHDGTGPDTADLDDSHDDGEASDVPIPEPEDGGEVAPRSDGSAGDAVGDHDGSGPDTVAHGDIHDDGSASDVPTAAPKDGGDTASPPDGAFSGQPGGSPGDPDGGHGSDPGLDAAVRGDIHAPPSADRGPSADGGCAAAPDGALVSWPLVVLFVALGAAARRRPGRASARGCQA